MHLKHATFVAQRAEEDKTKKKWIKTAQDQEEVDRWIKTKKKWSQDCARPRRSVDRWMKIQDTRSNHYTDAQVGDAEGLLLKSLWIKKQCLYRCPGWGCRRSLKVTMDQETRPKKQCLYRCPGWGRRRSLQVTMDHNTTTRGQSFHLFVTIIYVKNILYNSHTVFLSLYRYSTYPSIHSLLS